MNNSFQSLEFTSIFFSTFSCPIPPIPFGKDNFFQKDTIRNQKRTLGLKLMPRCHRRTLLTNTSTFRMNLLKVQIHLNVGPILRSSIQLHNIKLEYLLNDWAGEEI